jgi:hypothetical protein
VPYFAHMNLPAAIEHFALPPSTGSAASPIKAGTVLGEYTGNATQTLTVTATGGSYKLLYNGVATTAIAFNAVAATIQTALNAIPALSPAGVAVTGTGPWTITFQNQLGEQVVPLLTVDNTLATGGTAAVTAGTAGVAGQVGSYASGNSNGTQTPRFLLEYDCYTDASGNHFWGGGFWNEGLPSVPCFITGAFRCEDLTGLDAASLTQTGTRLTQVHGNTSIGVVKLG